MRPVLLLLVLLGLASAAHAQKPEPGELEVVLSEEFKPIHPDSAFWQATPIVTPYSGAEEAPPAYWVDPSLGITYRGVGMSVTVGHWLDQHRFVSVRLAGEETVQFMDDYGAHERTLDLGALYGVQVGTQAVSLMLSAGVAGVYGIRQRDLPFDEEDPFAYDIQRFVTVGVPITARIDLMPTEDAGVSFQAFANLNTVSPFAGVSMGWLLGY